MNWRWILMLSLLGVAMGVASVFGWTQGLELWLWIGIILVVAILLGYNVRAKLFMHGFLTAVVWSAVNGIVILSSWDTYMTHNPKTSESFAKVPEGMDPRWFMLIGIVIGALMWGVILGLLTMAAGKLLREKPQPESFPPIEPEQHDVTGQ